ncbi:hypothetical protein BIV57_20625 [Mangrovactinospora gilvigrisea]|uniref:NlpC/P60 domain-containing protein n=1 Tax=Mangrovactinospora gilvigrisea TaxID=1428644 RepID=A0A1J7C213_9ACTN|nr:C40 family peptidase [Mangrovactinospora gilvigrisea]OIV35608.1 hypothetical protein BIV57_20625 [Mangrovactinospora gilvigrisea]
MASHRRPKQITKSRARAGVITAAAATAVALGASTANAQPSASSVKSKLDKLNEQAEAANEKYLGAQEKEKAGQKEVNRLQDQVAAQQAKLNKLQDQIGQIAAAQYRSGGIDPTVQLMLSTHPDQFLDKAQAMDHLSAQQEEAVREMAAQKKVVDGKRQAAEAKLASLDKVTKQAASDKKDLQTKVHAAQKLLNSLTAQQRQQMQQQENSSAASSASKVTNVPASGRAGAALAAAKAELGKPYVYGATGPGSFDCSGLMQWAWRAAGVSLPRTSQAQASAGTRIGSLSQAQPGDLIVFYSGASHVGMYVGNGMIIHAPHTGAVVRYESASVMPIYDIVRPG